MGKGPAIVSVLTAGGGGDGGMVDLSKAVFKIALFIGIAIFFYSPWLNQPVPGDTWDKEPATGWEKGDWTWSAIDCIYFAMVTMTTVGYGDMPSLRHPPQSLDNLLCTPVPVQGLCNSVCLCFPPLVRALPLRLVCSVCLSGCHRLPVL